MRIKTPASSSPLMGWMFGFLATVAVLPIATHAMAGSRMGRTPVTFRSGGVETEDQLEQGIFVDCILAIEDANVNKDDVLERGDEYEAFLHTFDQGLFGKQATLQDNVQVPGDLLILYAELAELSHNESATDIDIFGANMDEVGTNDLRLFSSAPSQPCAWYSFLHSAASNR